MADADDFRFASAISDEDDTAEAVGDALGEAHDAMGGGVVDLAVVFASRHHRTGFAAVAERLRRQINPRCSIGATAAAVLASGREIESRAGLAVLLGRMPGAWLRSFSYEDLDWAKVRDDPPALRRAMMGPDEHAPGEPAAVLLFVDPFSVPMVKLLPAINAAMPGVPVVGGIASGADTGGDNRLLVDGAVLRQGAVGVVVGGGVRVGCTVSQGCRPIAQPFVITKAKHNIIQQIAGRPAMSVIREMADLLDEPDRRLLQNGLFIGRVINEYKSRFGRGDFLVRNIIGADQEHGYIAVNDLVRIGQTVQFHVRDADTAEEDLRMMLVAQKVHGPAGGAILCTCNGRGSHLFDRPDAESAIIGESLGHPPIAGFFAAGEIGPVGEQNFLHGFTSSLAVFRPAETL